jgi:hypothetical protein
MLLELLEDVLKYICAEMLDGYTRWMLARTCHAANRLIGRLGNGCLYTDKYLGAVQYGHFGELKWLFKCNRSIGRDSRICSYAAKYNRFEILKWACDRGFAWNSIVIENAIVNNNLAMLKWAYKNGCKLPNHCIIYLAIKYADLNMFKYVEHMIKKYDRIQASIYAANYGNVAVSNYISQQYGLRPTT